MKRKHFSPERWDVVRQAYREWWDGTLDRPLIAVTLHGYDPGRPEPALPGYNFLSRYALETPPQAVIDRMDYDLAGRRFFGDAFPSVWINFGPGVVATFLGATLRNAEETVWYQPPEVREITELRLRMNSANPWFRRIGELKQAAMAYWNGDVQVGMTDLGGTLDLVSTFRPGEKLLLDLYDHPEAVHQRSWEAHEAFWQAFRAFEKILSAANPGYTCWTPIFSETPYYMLQCDFAYMIGPEMFDRFVVPELQAACRRLDHAFFHLDGPGMLPHLDSLLSIPELKGIQWVPGAGAPDISQWPEVYRKIHAAGKRIQVAVHQSPAGLGIVDILAEQIGDVSGLIVIGGLSRDHENETRAVLGKYGADVGSPSAPVAN